MTKKLKDFRKKPEREPYHAKCDAACTTVYPADVWEQCPHCWQARYPHDLPPYPPALALPPFGEDVFDET
jgi:hypothetical protein